MGVPLAATHHGGMEHAHGLDPFAHSPSLFAVELRKWPPSLLSEERAGVAPLGEIGKDGLGLGSTLVRLLHLHEHIGPLAFDELCRPSEDCQLVSLNVNLHEADVREPKLVESNSRYRLLDPPVSVMGQDRRPPLRPPSADRRPQCGLRLVVRQSYVVQVDIARQRIAKVVEDRPVRFEGVYMRYTAGQPQTPWSPPCTDINRVLPTWDECVQVAQFRPLCVNLE